ncbi:MAG TPA: hypothetical protein VFR58_12130 [Flavisolibacter sp.]|nr:hypothetical protein [Flavisolibacter sp.]
MEEKDRLLQTIWEIVRLTSQPLNYPCSIREIILRYQGTWEVEQLNALSQENLINMVNAERVVVYITQAGLDRVQSIAAEVSDTES